MSSHGPGLFMPCSQSAHNNLCELRSANTIACTNAHAHTARIRSFRVIYVHVCRLWLGWRPFRPRPRVCAECSKVRVCCARWNCPRTHTRMLLLGKKSRFHSEYSTHKMMPLRSGTPAYAYVMFTRRVYICIYWQPHHARQQTKQEPRSPCPLPLRTAAQSLRHKPFQVPRVRRQRRHWRHWRHWRLRSTRARTR